jgi:hypothetical protein
MLIDENTTFIVQGITGREAVNLTRECLDYGSKIVGGVTPGRRGREVHGVPVYDSVAQLVEAEGGRPPDGSVVTVPPAFTRDAVFEAIEAGIKLIVIVTERIPRYDVAQMVELANLRGARIIGPNCLGIIRPGVAKMGGIGGPAKDAAKSYQPGNVGVMSRSGGMTTEISSTLTAAGLGVSTARRAASCSDTLRSQYSTPYFSRILKPSSSQAPGMRKIAIFSAGSKPSSTQALSTPRASMSTRVLETIDIITAIFSTPGLDRTSLVRFLALDTDGLPPISQ